MTRKQRPAAGKRQVRPYERPQLRKREKLSQVTENAVLPTEAVIA
jgi:hypothetical protein